MARPSKLTPETRDIIIEGIRLGLRYDDAALAAGVSYQTIRNWVKKGEENKSGKYVEFLDALKVAEGEGEKMLVALIQKAARKQWQAAAWILERRHREKWGRNLDVTSGNETIGLVINIGDSDDD